MFLNVVKNYCQKILNSNVTYYIIVPFFLLFLEWIKNWYDINRKGIKYALGKHKNICPFFSLYRNFSMGIYLIFCGLMFIYELIEIFEIKISHLEIYFLCTMNILGIIYLIKKLHEEIYQIELLKYKICKIISFILEELSFSLPIIYLNNQNIAYVWLTIQIVLLIMVNFFSDHILIYRNRYVAIVIEGGEILKDIQIDKLYVRKRWLIIKEDTNKIIREHRIREEDVVRIDYYGEKYIKCYCPFLKWFALEP